MEPLTIKVFPGATSLPLWTAQARGLFAARGLAVDIRYTGGSVEQLTELIAGKHDLIMTLMDNVVAYASHQGEVAAAGDSDLIAVIGADDGFSCLAVQPGIAGIGDLRGRVVSVDAMTTGLAFLLRRLLAQHGLDERDVTFVPLGGVFERWQAMMQGEEHAATMLVTPFDFMAEPKGVRVLARGAAAVPAYQGNVIATRRRWAEANRERLDAFCAAWLETMDWLFLPENATAAAGILCANMPDLTPSVAERTCALFLSSEGFTRDGGCDRAAIAGVLELRNAYGPGLDPVRDAGSFVDPGFVRRARALIADRTPGT